jgi:hypothetical protein
VLPAGRAAVSGGGLLLSSGLLGPELGLRPFVLRPGATGLNVREPLGRERQVVVEPTGADADAGEPLGDLRTAALGGGPARAACSRRCSASVTRARAEGGALSFSGAPPSRRRPRSAARAAVGRA